MLGPDRGLFCTLIFFWEGRPGGALEQTSVTSCEWGKTIDVQWMMDGEWSGSTGLVEELPSSERLVVVKDCD